jgi:hypothetical protein
VLTHTRACKQCDGMLSEGCIEVCVMRSCRSLIFCQSLEQATAFSHQHAHESQQVILRHGRER